MFCFNRGYDSVRVCECTLITMGCFSKLEKRHKWINITDKLHGGHEVSNPRQTLAKANMKENYFNIKFHITSTLSGESIAHKKSVISSFHAFGSGNKALNKHLNCWWCEIPCEVHVMSLSWLIRSQRTVWHESSKKPICYNRTCGPVGHYLNYIAVP